MFVSRTMMVETNQSIFVFNSDSTPPSDILKEILYSVPRVSFYGFLVAIAKSEKISAHIGEYTYFATLVIKCAVNCLVMCLIEKF